MFKDRFSVFRVCSAPKLNVRHCFEVKPDGPTGRGPCHLSDNLGRNLANNPDVSRPNKLRLIEI